jgi:hypothetical protein
MGKLGNSVLFETTNKVLDRHVFFESFAVVIDDASQVA